MCIFHNSPDGFFWAEREFPILLDRYVFRLFAAAADVYIFIILRMDSSEQDVSLPFSWIVIFSIRNFDTECIDFYLFWNDEWTLSV